MNLSSLSVRRPVLAAVAALLLCVVGVAAFIGLPVRELPSIDPPIVSITTRYVGASAEVIENRITEPIEQQIAGIQGVQRVNSVSRDGLSRINIEFTLDRDMDAAANDVRDRVARVVRNLPVQADPPEIAKADADASPIVIMWLQSRDLDRLQLTDYAERYLVERFSTVPGVARVNIFGDQSYAMRVWLDSDALAARGLTVQDVEQALQTQNAELPAGFLESEAKDFTVRVARGYATPAQFEALPIASRGGAQGGYVTRLGDVARIEEAAVERRRMFRGNGVSQIGLAITRQAQANDLEISKGVHAMLEQVRPSLPRGTTIEIGVDNSRFTSEAIREVYVTIAIALALVALVNVLFLGTLRAAFIPSVVAPICLLATFIVLAPLGFSVNLLTLLALVLAIGLVVDDAIVVTENIQRRIDLGEPPLVAAERGARQVFFAVVATTVVLIAVFAPLMFLPGYVGRLFVELAVAITAAVAFSSFLALTLSPMLSSKILRPANTERAFAKVMNRAMDALRDSYRASLQAVLGKAGTSAAAAVLVIGVAACAWGLFQHLPRELVPPEDRGRVFIRVEAPEGSGFDYASAEALKLEPVLEGLRENGEAERYLVSAPGFGGSGFNTANAIVVLTDQRGRERSAEEVAADLTRQFGSVTGARVFAQAPGPFQRGGGGGGGTSVDFIVTGSDFDELFQWIQPIQRAAADNPGFSRPRLDYQPNAPRVLVRIDRERAAALGVSAQDVGRALETMFGSRRATTYIRGGQEYDVVLQTERDNRRGEQDLNTLYVRTGAGALVPLSSVVATEVRGDTPDRRRLDRLRAITLSTDLAPGYTVADAVTWFQTQASEQPPGPVVRWGGQARDLNEAGGAVALAFGMALLLVFLVLAAQFESWISPFVIMLTVPLAALGGLFGLLMAGSSLNIYSQIGLIILIGVAAKNGILIVEFANQLRDQGREVREAIVEAASLRLRPIIMTSIATAFGALPLILWQGAGAGSRLTIGVVIFSGALFATLLTLFVVPVAYGWLARFSKSPDYVARRIREWEAEEARPPQAAE